MTELNGVVVNFCYFIHEHDDEPSLLVTTHPPPQFATYLNAYKQKVGVEKRTGKDFLKFLVNEMKCNPDRTFLVHRISPK